MDTAIDLFAGLGGFTEGALQAGLRVLLAANHWAAAISCHAANHPGIRHATEDLTRVEWDELPHFHWLLASPSCTGHTRARGRDQKHHDEARATAWAVVRAARARRPGVIVVENVVEFQAWHEYKAWCHALEGLGYCLSPQVIDAADLGVPQHRVRLFVVGTRSRKPIQIHLEPMEHRPIEPAIQWAQGRWSPVLRPRRAVATLARIQRGRTELGADRFLIPYYGSGSGRTGRSLSRPLGTVTTRDRWALIDGDRMRMLQPPELRAAMGFPEGYGLPTPDDKKLTSTVQIRNRQLRSPQYLSDHSDEIESRVAFAARR